MYEELFMGNQKVIIVKGSGQEAQYAQMLFQLIGKFPNTESSQPITEAEYNTSFTTIGKMPNGKIIFFGNGKEAEIQGKAVKWKFNRYGMKYGWTGNRCVITAHADEIPLEKQYEFSNYYNGKIKELNALMDNANFSIQKYSEYDKIDVDDMLDEITWKENDDVGDKIAKTLATIVGGPLLLFAKGLSVVNDVTQGTKARFERNDIWKRQYELLIGEFILNGFEAFMNSANEKRTGGKAIIVYDYKEAAYAHSLYNLMQQYGEYDVGEYTEKMFIDNAKELSSKNKIIFLGETKTSKERWLDFYRYRFDKNGMRYGWQGSHAFLNIRTLSKSEVSEFIEAYEQKRNVFENEAKAYIESKHSENIRKGETALNVIDALSTQFSLLSLPTLIINGMVRKKIGDTINSAIMVEDLKQYQYEMLVREFVFGGLEEFMEG